MDRGSARRNLQLLIEDGVLATEPALIVQAARRNGEATALNAPATRGFA